MTDISDQGEIDISYDLEITKMARQASTKGVWVAGRLAGHKFEALVFELRAQRAEWELGASRISKLWLRREADRRVVYSWDRGLDVPAADAHAERIVGFITAGLAEYVFGC